VKATVKPLKIARGSSFTLATEAGTLRSGQGVFSVRIQMSEPGLGMFTVELTDGAAQFEPPGGSFKPLPLGKKLVFALESDNGTIKLGEMPKAQANAKK
jgi:hypothetical protein